MKGANSDKGKSNDNFHMGAQGSGDGAGKHKRKASTAQPGEGSPPAMQRLQERHDLSQEPPNSRPVPVPVPGAVQPAEQ